MYEISSWITLFLIVFGFLPKNRLVVTSRSPGDASFSAQFYGLCYEPLGGEDETTRRRMVIVVV